MTYDTLEEIESEFLMYELRKSSPPLSPDYDYLSDTKSPATPCRFAESGGITSDIQKCLTPVDQLITNPVVKSSLSVLTDPLNSVIPNLPFSLNVPHKNNKITKTSQKKKNKINQRKQYFIPIMPFKPTIKEHPLNKRKRDRTLPVIGKKLLKIRNKTHDELTLIIKNGTSGEISVLDASQRNINTLNEYLKELTINKTISHDIITKHDKEQNEYFRRSKLKHKK